MATDQAEDLAGAALDQVQQKANQKASEQMGIIADGLEQLAKAIDSASDQLRQDNQPTVAAIMHRAAEPVSEFSEYLRDKDLDTLVGELDRFAHRQPALFFGGAFLLGVFGARLLKSTSHRAGPGRATQRSFYESRYREPRATLATLREDVEWAKVQRDDAASQARRPGRPWAAAADSSGAAVERGQSR